jgi:hypothetical protein
MVISFRLKEIPPYDPLLPVAHWKSVRSGSSLNAQHQQSTQTLFAFLETAKHDASLYAGA